MMSVAHYLKKPDPLPLAIACDIIDRLKPLDISQCSGWFTNLVSARIADTGKHVDDLTVREIRSIIEECSAGANAAAKRKLFQWKKFE